MILSAARLRRLASATQPQKRGGKPLELLEGAPGLLKRALQGGSGADAATTAERGA